MSLSENDISVGNLFEVIWDTETNPIEMWVKIDHDSYKLVETNYPTGGWTLTNPEVRTFDTSVGLPPHNEYEIIDHGLKCKEIIIGE
jgi:hypothetical protein